MSGFIFREEVFNEKGSTHAYVIPILKHWAVRNNNNYSKRKAVAGR
jgi:hypothetical protein